MGGDGRILMHEMLDIVTQHCSKMSWAFRALTGELKSGHLEYEPWQTIETLRHSGGHKCETEIQRDCIYDDASYIVGMLGTAHHT